MACAQTEAKGLKHDSEGLLSLDADQSFTQFAVTFAAVPEFDTKVNRTGFLQSVPPEFCFLQRTVFGKVTQGLDVLRRIEAQGS